MDRKRVRPVGHGLALLAFGWPMGSYGAEPAAAATHRQVHHVRLGIGSQGRPFAEVLGSETAEALAARAPEVLRTIGGDDAPARPDAPGWPGLAAAQVSGWGDTEAEAARNALSRLMEVLSLRQQAVYRSMVAGGGGEVAPFRGARRWSRFMWLLGEEPPGSEEAVEVAMGELANLTWAGWAGPTEAVVLATEVLAPGPVRAIWHSAGRDCGPGFELRATPANGAAHDLLAEQGCRAYVASSNQLMTNALADASLEVGARMVDAGLWVIDTCQLACLQEVEITVVP